MNRICWGRWMAGLPTTSRCYSPVGGHTKHECPSRACLASACGMICDINAACLCIVVVCTRAHKRNAHSRPSFNFVHAFVGSPVQFQVVVLSAVAAGWCPLPPASPASALLKLLPFVFMCFLRSVVLARVRMEHTGSSACGVLPTAEFASEVCDAVAVAEFKRFLDLAFDACMAHDIHALLFY